MCSCHSILECCVMFSGVKSSIRSFVLFKTLRYGGGGALWPSLVTLVFLKVEGQNLVAWGILMCLLQKWH